jgi:predicted Abi (CAAX) family protease
MPIHAAPAISQRSSSYFRYIRDERNRPSYYPLDRHPDPALYRPVAKWAGRLILPPPEARNQVRGALIELHLVPDGFRHLIGATIRLRWVEQPSINVRYWGVTRPVIFSPGARQLAASGRLVPERLDGWNNVNPFESLAGFLPNDDMVVRLPEPVVIEEHPAGGGPIAWLQTDPIQTTGRYYALVRFLGQADRKSDTFRVAHFNRATRDFDGAEDVVRLPEVVMAADGIRNAVTHQIELSPANTEGWYIFGAPDAEGAFVVQSYAPRGLFRLKPQRIVEGRSAGFEYLKPRAWKETDAKGTFTTGLIVPDGASPEASLNDWRVGDRALIIHLFGVIGGPKGEANARFPLCWGHSSYGVASVVHEPLADEPAFDVTYHQVYVSGTDGVVPCTQHYSRYSGDRQFGFLGVRPIQDILIKLDSFTEPFDFDGMRHAALDTATHELQIMMARYRIGDGRGGSRVTSANNCSQDSNQALYAAVRDIDLAMRSMPHLQDWRQRNPDQDSRVHRLLALGEDLRRKMLPFGAARADWEYGSTLIGSTLSESQLRSLGVTLKTWRTVLPSVGVRAIARVFLAHGAQAWVLRTNQVGGYDPGIEPYVPNV